MGDSFYVLEYLGHPNGDLTLLDTLSLQMGTGISNWYFTPDFGGSPEPVVKLDRMAEAQAKNRATTETALKQKMIDKMALMAGAGFSNTLDRRGIPSILPGAIGEKLTDIEVEVSASVGVPQAEITFSACHYKDLSEGFGGDYTWHNRGAGYRVWVGNIIKDPTKIGLPRYKYSCIFEGAVSENKYSYAQHGVDVALTLSSHKALKANMPLEYPIWTGCTTVFTLFSRVAEALGIPPDKRLMMFGDETSNKDVKDKMVTLFGRDLTAVEIEEGKSEKYLTAVAYYNSVVLPKITNLHAGSKYYPTPVMLLNMIATSLDFILRWHITTTGELFMGIPLNPKITAEAYEQNLNLADGMRQAAELNVDGFEFYTVGPSPLGKPPKKIFSYRPSFDTPLKAMDYLDVGIMSSGYSDFYESITLGELERGVLPLMERGTFSAGDTLGGEKDESENGTTDDATGTDSVEGALSKFKVGNAANNPAVQSIRGGLTVSFTGTASLSDDDLNKINLEAFSLGTVSMSIGGCLPDPYLQLLDTFEFRGYSLHSGRYLVTAINYSFKSGSRPTMEIRGVTSLSQKDFTGRNSGVEVMETGLNKELVETEKIKAEARVTNAVEGDTAVINTENTKKAGGAG